MIITEERIVVTADMMNAFGMIESDKFGVPIDPIDPSKGIAWKRLSDFEDADFDKIEEYFMHKQNSNGSNLSR